MTSRNWLNGDPGLPSPPADRQQGRNDGVASPDQLRRHLHARQVGVSLVRGWDLAFHCAPLALQIDPDFAKRSWS
jgi:hypothetical protein